MSYEKEMKNPYELDAPKGFWTQTKQEFEKTCNGAGPKGFGWIVPDTIWLMSITDCSNIHDYDYGIGGTKKDKIKIDLRYLDNMTKKINKCTRWKWLKRRRIARAKIYYEAVKQCGMPAFNLKS